MSFKERYGKLAVVAGGSDGVGAAYANGLADLGLDLLLVARDPAKLDRAARDIRSRHPGCEVLTLSVDLSTEEAPGRILETTAGKEVGMLVCNAGASSRTGSFVDGDLDFARRLLTINTTTQMVLSHAYGREMKSRGRGGIILVSSLACLIGSPSIAVYSAAKAFCSNFAEALWHELKPFGVDVLSHVLSTTDTPSNARNFPWMSGQGDSAEEVARQGLDALGSGPVLRAGGGDELAAVLAAMPREEAINQVFEAGAPFRERPGGA